MKEFCFSIFLLGLAGALFAEPSVRPVGVAVVFDPMKEEFKGFSTLNQHDAVTLALLVDLDGAGIIEVDANKSKLDELSDDTGQNLKGKLWTFPNISEDKKLMRIEVKGEEAPANGAKALKATGTLVIQTAEESTVLKSEIVAAKKGERMKLSKDLSFKISDTGKPQWGDDPQMVEFEIKRDVPELAEMVFYDKDGQVIESNTGGTSRMSMGKMVTLKLTYRLKRKVEEFRVEAKVWTDLEEVEVPFDVTLGIGG